MKDAVTSSLLTICFHFCMGPSNPSSPLREGTFYIGGGGGGLGQGILEFFGEKSRGPPPSWNGLMHHLSEIPKQKHLTLPLPIQDKNNRK